MSQIALLTNLAPNIPLHRVPFSFKKQNVTRSYVNSEVSLNSFILFFMIGCSYSFEISKLIDSLDSLHILEVDDSSISLADFFFFQILII